MTLYISGAFILKKFPISSITDVKAKAKVPEISMRTNGISLGSYNVGHFRTKDQRDVLLYLHSDKTDVTYIKTRENEEIFINFKDSVKSYDFSNNLKQIFTHGCPSKY